MNIIEDILKFDRFNERMRILKVEYEKLLSDENAWTKELEEREIFEGTLNDGLEDYES